MPITIKMYIDAWYDALSVWCGDGTSRQAINLWVYDGTAWRQGVSPSGPSADPYDATEEIGPNSNVWIYWFNGDATAETRIYKGGALIDTVAAGVTSYDSGSGNTGYDWYVAHYKDGIEGNHIFCTDLTS